jgi:anti-sigma B factor antagonist
MKIDERFVGDVAVVAIDGDITLKGGDVRVRDKVQSLLQQGHRKLVIDLGGVSYVDSAGLGQLVQVYATTTRLEGRVKLIRLTKRLRDLLVLTRLATVFDTYDTEAEALASFESAAKA